MPTNSKTPVKFNPVKQDVDGKQAMRMIWSTESVELGLKGLKEGRKLIANPFYDNNTKLLKGDLVFQRTDEEKAEWLKCAKDICYFAEKYCKLMTPEGIKHIKLRDYQIRYLKHLEQHKLSIMVSCRQAGKCLSYISEIQCILTDNFFNEIDDNLTKYLRDNYYIKDGDYYELPLFELINCYNNSLSWKIEYRLYKLIYKLTLWKAKKNLKEDKSH